MIYPDPKTFLKLAKKGNMIPVYREILCDVETPVSAYFKLAKQSPYSFLLESVEGEEKVARYSFVARNPEFIIRVHEGQLETQRFSGKKVVKSKSPLTENPLKIVRDLMKPYRWVSIDGLPRFCGGLLGYLGYDVVRFFERLPNKPADGVSLPDILLALVNDIIIFDHKAHTIKVVSCVNLQAAKSEEEKHRAYQAAVRRIDGVVRELNQPLKVPKSKISKTSKMAFKSNLTKDQFKNIVLRAKEYINAGDIIQVVLSQRFEATISADPFNIYRRLRVINPSAYMYYLNFGDVQLVGSSPELLVRCVDGVAETRPIAGTRPRGKSEEEDAILAQDLLADPKEKAEHIMLVDLGRNDLGRVCQQGTVHLSEFKTVEKYSHVMHMVSNVRGKVQSDKDGLDVLEAAFPAGTVSGAPKIRAMEIIDELENVSRGPYAGCIGYFSFSGNMDSCITIRTIVVKGKKAYVQAGAGIVADSDPDKEYQETVNKARAQLNAIELAMNNEI